MFAFSEQNELWSAIALLRVVTFLVLRKTSGSSSRAAAPAPLTPAQTCQVRQATYGFNLQGIIYISSEQKRKPNQISTYSIYLE